MKKLYISKISLFCFLLLAILFANCAKENTFIVNDDIQPYFNLFEEEALKRGIEINLETELVNGVIMDIADSAVYGQCATNASTGIRTVRVDRLYWEASTAAEREFLIFHELGHCVLNRSHIEDRDNNGHCVSIMHSGTGSCQFRYTENNRVKYLDELFQ